MLALYIILFGCLLGNTVFAMEKLSLPTQRSRGAYFMSDSEDETEQPGPLDAARHNSVDSIKAMLNAVNQYEVVLMKQLYDGEISHEEFNAYFENKSLNLLLLIIPTDPHINAVNNCNYSRLHLAILLGEKDSPKTLTTCKELIEQGASIALQNSLRQTPLYLASVHKESVPLTKALLTTCPSIKPAIKLIWLVGKRSKRPLPKVVLLNCLVPYIIFNETEIQIGLITNLITEVLKEKTIYRPNPMAGRNVPVVSKRKLFDLVETNELKQLLDPLKIEQHRRTIQEKLYASIGIFLTKQAKEELII